MLDPRRAAAFFLLLSAPGLAQTPCYAENDGSTFHDTTHMGGPNLILAIKFTAPALIAATRMEVFTGETTGNNALSFWSHDAANNRPLAQISGLATWSMSTTNSWQGADLAAAFPLTGGTTYWLAWSCIQQSQASIEPPSAVVGQPYCASTDGGQNWAGPFQSTTNNWKFRVFCGGGGGGSVTVFCLGDGTQTPPCPCGNSGAAGHGCRHSINTAGARLSWSGTTSPDALFLNCIQVRPLAVAIVYQTDVSVPAAAFGDGLSCLGGTLRRLYVKDAVSSVVTVPGIGDSTITQRSATLGDPIPSGATRYYQVVYRDGNQQFCPSPSGSTFNVSSGLSVVW